MSKEKIDKKELIKFAQEAEGLIARLNVLGKESVAILKEIDCMKSVCDKPIVDILACELNACKAEIEKCTVGLQTCKPSPKEGVQVHIIPKKEVQKKVKDAPSDKEEIAEVAKYNYRGAKKHYSPDFISLLLKLKEQGFSYRQIARKLDISFSSVSAIISRHRTDI